MGRYTQGLEPDSSVSAASAPDSPCASVLVLMLEEQNLEMGRQTHGVEQGSSVSAYSDPGSPCTCILMLML